MASRQERARSGDLGLYAPRELFERVPPGRRDQYLRVVKEFAEMKYQLGVAIARELPSIMAERPDAVEPYLLAMRRLGRANWRMAVEAARVLHLLQEAPDSGIADGYEAILTEASRVQEEDLAEEEQELAQIEASLRGFEERRARVEALRTRLAARRSREQARQDQAARLAEGLPEGLAQVRPDRRAAYLAGVGQVAAIDPEASVQAAESLRDLLNGGRVSGEGAGEWVRRGLEILDRNREVGRGYFRLGTKQSLQVVEELREGLQLRSVARVLKLYATALSGREVAIRGTDEMEAVNYGADHIVLPPDMHLFDDEAENFIAYKVATAHGAGRIEFGTYAFSLDDVPGTVARLRARNPDGGGPS